MHQTVVVVSARFRNIILEQMLLTRLEIVANFFIIVICTSYSSQEIQGGTVAVVSQGAYTYERLC